MVNIEVFSRYKAKLGEGPVYDIELDKLFWLDIVGMKIITSSLGDSLERIINTPDFVSSLCVINENRIIVTIRHGFYMIDLLTNAINKMVEVETNLEENRFNDGKCDKLGRYWAGTMHIPEKLPTGNLYKLEGNRVIKMVEGLTVSNGLGWSPDNDKMYLIDSTIRKVYSFDFDLNKGEVYNREVLIDFNSAHELGYPDGMAVDEEGYLWIAHWGGGKITRWSPKGKKVFEIKLPVTFVTSITFGTKDMNKLFITTADSNFIIKEYWKEKAEEGRISAREDEPLSGKLFIYNTEVKGLPNYRFKYVNI